MKYTDEEIRPVAEFLHALRVKHNFEGDDKKDWREAVELLVGLETEDMLRRDYGKTVSYE